MNYLNYFFLFFYFFQEISCSLSSIWSTQLPNSIDYSQPFIDNNNRVFIGCINNQIYCLNYTSGSIIWSYETSAPVYNSPIVGDGKVFIASGNTMYALSPLNGQVIWSYPTQGSFFQITPEYLNGKLFFGSGDGMFHCVDSSNGKSIWSYTTGTTTAITSPTIFNNEVFYGTYSGFMVHLDINGNLIWNNTYPSPIRTRPSVISGYLYFGTLSGNAYIVSLPSHQLISVGSFPSGSLTRQILLTQTTAFIALDGGYLAACGLGGFGALWTTQLSEGWTDPVINNDVLYIGNRDNNIYEISSTNGIIFSTTQTGADVTAPPRIFQNNLVIGGYDQYVRRYQIISNFPSIAPSPYPTAVPSINPTISTFITNYYCNPYNLTNTSSATTHYSSCSISLCYNQIVDINLCMGGLTIPDTFIRLFDSNNIEISYNDDSDGLACSKLSYHYTKSKIKCEVFVLHQGCFGISPCIGQANINIYQPTDYLVKYGIVFIFNNTELSLDKQAVNVNYYYDQVTQKSKPLQYSSYSNEYLSRYDVTPNQNQILIKWRAVKQYLPSNNIVYNYWSGSKFIQATQILYLVISQINDALIGFICKDESTQLYHYYQFTEYQLPSRHLSEVTIPFGDGISNTQVSVNSVQTFTQINKFTSGISNKNLYLIEFNHD